MPPARPAETEANEGYSLVADVGGTNTRVALADGTRLLPDTVRRYPNRDFDSLETVLRRFIADTGGVECAAACVALAGPVQDGAGEMTNLDWTFDRDTLTRATGARRVAILNDLQAQGHGLDHIAPDNLAQIIPGPIAGPRATRLVIGLGTGFNIAPVFAQAGGVLVTPSETGHTNMPVRTEADLRLCRHIEARMGFCGTEEVLSGSGLVRIYDWLGHESGETGKADAAAIMAACGDGSDPRAEKAAAMFVHLFAMIAGNLALIHLPFGGIFLSGGVSRAFTPHFERFGFTAAFRDKGRFSHMMDHFGVAVIEDDFAALAGCAGHLAAPSL